LGIDFFGLITSGRCVILTSVDCTVVLEGRFDFSYELEVFEYSFVGKPQVLLYRGHLDHPVVYGDFLIARVECPSFERFSVEQSDPCFLPRVGETMNRGGGNEKGS